jgi:potassium efflux system protein
MMAHRRMAIEEARKRRATQAEGAAATPRHAEAPVIVEEQKLKLRDISEQTRRLLRAAVVCGLVFGLWFIWVDMLPALNVLKRFEVWPRFGQMSALVENQAASASRMQPEGPRASEPIAATGITIQAPDSSEAVDAESAGQGQATPAGAEAGERVVTLANVLLALILIIVTYAVSRNIPGLLEITLLQRLPLEPMGRYAFSTLVRYALFLIGAFLAFGAIGIGWDQVQWLAAAITLGIGFGLQEIFANFISGLILLFEQPIRVGDTVTVNGIDGTVTRIRMRATTIIDYDRKEIIIPNKAFITGQIVNWTLTDAISRLVFKVGVSYGSDVAAVERTLAEVATSNQHVLKDPAPQIVFAGFGDSTLDFSLRVFIPNLENVLAVRHAINAQILTAFRKQGIQIAFPQQEIRIHSIDAPIRITDGPGGSPPQS